MRSLELRGTNPGRRARLWVTPEPVCPPLSVLHGAGVLRGAWLGRQAQATTLTTQHKVRSKRSDCYAMILIADQRLMPPHLNTPWSEPAVWNNGSAEVFYRHRKGF
jgi:hypothetical protein